MNPLTARPLDAPHDGLVFIEARMAPQDAPLNLICGSHACAALGYGPRGPWHRPGSQTGSPSQTTQ